MRDEKEIFGKIKDFFIKDLRVEASKIDLESDLRQDLNIDSVDVIDLLAACEDEFGVRIEDEEFASIKTVEDVVKSIKNKIQ